MTPALRCDFVIVECINFSYARQVRVIVDREARCKINRMPALSKDDKLRLLRIILESRYADLREQNLIRQGKGHFHVSGMGHEALAAVSIQMEPDDYIVPYYRDRGLVLGRGMTTQQLALEYFAKRKTGSAGRMMPSHYSDLERADADRFTASSRLRNGLGNSAGRQKKCRRHNCRRRCHSAG